MLTTPPAAPTSVRARPLPVAITRILLGLATLVTNLEFAADLTLLQEGRILTPTTSWFPTAADLPVELIFLVTSVASLLLVVGLFVPACAIVLIAFGMAIQLADLQMYHNHLTLQLLLLLALIPAHSDRALAVGAARRRTRRPDVPWWPQLVMLAALSSCYVFAGLSKANPTFLGGNEIDSLHFVTIPDRLVPVAAMGVVVGEVAIGVGLWFTRARRLAVIGGVALHLSITVLLDSPFAFAAFALLCISVYPLILTRPVSEPGSGPAG